MSIEMKCPNGCAGYVPCDTDVTDDGADGVWSFGSYTVAFVNDAENATSHDSGCPPLTDEQRQKIEEEAALAADESRYDEP